jgi:type I restriction enzyme S subunit
MKPETFFDNFDVLAEAPNGVQKLRELILQLAVRGKLVAQDERDEPAAVLLKRIKTERDRLIKEKKIKKIEPLPPIDSNEMQYSIPKSWQWVDLGEIGQVVGGGTPDTKNPDYFTEKGISWLTPADLYGSKHKYIGRGRRDLSERGLKESSAQLMPAGTVIFSSRAPIGYVAIAKNDLATNQGFKSLIPYIIEMNEYIYYFLKKAGKEIDESASGTTFKEIPGKEFVKVQIPLPPLAEQHRIVAKVDQLMSLCDELETLQQKKRESRARLNSAALDRLLAARAPGEFAEGWRRIFDNFDLLYDAPENVAALRKVIMQLAVRGKLVPQNLNDEPASILLERIIVEKKKLLKEGKIKETGQFPIETEDAPFELPSKWKWTCLYDIGKINPRNMTEDDTEVSFIPMTLISETSIKPIGSEKRRWGEVKKGFTHFAEDDVALAKITPCFQNGKSAVMRGLTNKLGAGTTELHVFR